MVLCEKQVVIVVVAAHDFLFQKVHRSTYDYNLEDRCPFFIRRTSSDRSQ